MILALLYIIDRIPLKPTGSGLCLPPPPATILIALPWGFLGISVVKNLPDSAGDWV